MSPLDFDRIGVVVGLTAEARIARRFFARVEIGGGTALGAEAAVRRLIGQGVGAVVSFGLAGGLDPLLRPGAVIVPDAVVTQGRSMATDPALNGLLGGETAHTVLGADGIAATVVAKQYLFVATSCAAVDLESGAVARAGLPFAVLRAICDPAERDLPPAALSALSDAGAIGFLRVIGSVVARPGQLPALLALGRDAVAVVCWPVTLPRLQPWRLEIDVARSNPPSATAASSNNPTNARMTHSGIPEQILLNQPPNSCTRALSSSSRNTGEKRATVWLGSKNPPKHQTGTTKSRECGSRLFQRACLTWTGLVAVRLLRPAWTVPVGFSDRSGRWKPVRQAIREP